VKRVANAIARWYKGEDVPPDNDPHSPLVFMLGHRQYHWTARAARRVVRFCCEEWKWLIGTVLAIAGLLVAALAALHKF
jgi:hypothetical protein